MNILWIEDFDNFEGDVTTLEEMFGDLFASSLKRWSRFDSFVEEPILLKNFCEKNKLPFSIYLIRSLFEFYQLTEMLGGPSMLDREFDVVIIDINLSKNEGGKFVPDGFKEELLNAREGLYVYNILVKDGFQSSNMCFMTANYENTYLDFRTLCQKALIPAPKAFSKFEGYTDFRLWLMERARDPYFLLRRGVIEGVKFLKTQIDKFRFKFFCKDKNDLPIEKNPEAYLETLVSLLPSRRPAETKESHVLTIFLRALSHIWESRSDPRNILQAKGFDDCALAENFGFIMKQLRNLSSHNNSLGRVTSVDCAFFFLVNIRAIFQLSNDVEPFERRLFEVFELNEVAKDEIRKKLYQSYLDIRNRLRKLQENYSGMDFSNKTIFYSQILKYIQNSTFFRCEKRFFMNSTLRLFWFHKCKFSKEYRNLIEEDSSGISTIKDIDLLPEFRWLEENGFCKEFCRRTFAHCFD